MKQWLDFIPLFAFFATFKTLGIFPATAVLIGSSVLVYGAIWLKDRHLENSQKVTLVATILFGSVTLLLHDETYLKWKAPVINWIFAAAFLGSMYIGEQPLVQRMMAKAFDMPANVWRKLNWAWIIFFVVAGAANAYVAFHFPKYWVDFKVFGSLGMTLTFIIGQMIILSRYIKQEEIK
jgi:intracellular septation protein